MYSLIYSELCFLVLFEHGRTLCRKILIEKKSNLQRLKCCFSGQLYRKMYFCKMFVSLSLIMLKLFFKANFTTLYKLKYYSQLFSLTININLQFCSSLFDSNKPPRYLPVQLFLVNSMRNIMICSRRAQLQINSVGLRKSKIEF